MIDLDALIDWCESPAFDPADEDGLAAAAPMLRALARVLELLSSRFAAKVIGGKLMGHLKRWADPARHILGLRHMLSGFALLKGKEKLESRKLVMKY